MKNMQRENIAEELRAQAIEQSPRFSENLHRNIMGRIADAPFIAPAAAPRNHPMSPRFIAAAAVLAVGLGRLYFMHRSVPNSGSPQPRIALTLQMPSVPKIQNPVDVLEQPALAQWTAARYSDIDQDGEKLIGYMARQLDVLPRPQTR